jgi:hypothetical protein
MLCISTKNNIKQKYIEHENKNVYLYSLYTWHIYVIHLNDNIKQKTSFFITVYSRISAAAIHTKQNIEMEAKIK